MPPDVKSRTPEELHDVLEALDRVMADAERLRQTITRQLSDTRHDQLQTLSSGSGPTPSMRVRKRR